MRKGMIAKEEVKGLFIGMGPKMKGQRSRHQI